MEAPLQITALGHASMLVETPQVRCLVDPVYFDPFEDGAVVSCPSREVRVGEIPPPDLLILTHRHPDHVDPPSLDRVPRDCQVLCPDDPLVVGLLRALGFDRIRIVAAGTQVVCGDLEILCSDSCVPGLEEFGVALRSGGASLWNQVDTFPSAESLQRVVAFADGVLDVHVAKHASQNFSFFDRRTVDFPSTEHATNLANAISAGAGLVLPGANGFRFHDDHGWLNRFLFPVSTRRFLADLRHLSPEQRGEPLRPGDVVKVMPGRAEVDRGTSPLVRLLADDEALRAFDPTAPVPPLSEPLADGAGAKSVEAKVRQALVEDLGAFIASDEFLTSELGRLYRRRRAVYAVGVVLAGGREIHFTWGGEGSGGLRETSELDPEWDVLHRIAGSALLDWMANRKSPFYVRAYSRRASRLVQLDRAGTELKVRLEPNADLLTVWMQSRARRSRSDDTGSVDVTQEAARQDCLVRCGLECRKARFLRAAEEMGEGDACCLDH